MQHRGWIIRHDPLPLPPGHNEWEGRPEDAKPSDWRILRGQSEQHVREMVDYWLDGPFPILTKDRANA